ncbi:MAG TPA: hypothetical protein PK142_01520 [bacterium]|nr:hypothetical protein [bacterium]
MNKNVKDICYVDGQEHFFLYNLIPYKEKWFCDVIKTEDSAIESNVRIVPFDKITFANDPKGERKNYLIQCETAKSDALYKKIADNIKEKIKKIQQLEAAGEA